jgi:nucleoside-diphosphate-sugar epimerase
VARSLDHGVLAWPLGRWVGFGVAAVAQFFNRARGRSSMLNVDKIREAAVRSWACSAEKARRQLNFAPSKPLDERLRETSQWLLSHGWV